MATKKRKRNYSKWQKYGYNAKRDNPAYDKWRAKVKAKYPVCVVCGISNNLEAHHVVPFSVGRWKRYRISNGRMLCANCHALYHNEYEVQECNQKTLEAFVKKYKPQ
jgi:5-methylcytosine-specific restriction endonuclease McrA